jgi:hypothetical protein
MPEVTKEINGRAGTSQKEARTANKRPGQTKGFAPKMIKFEGKCADLKGHIYDCSDVRQSDQFTKTTKEVAEYVGRTYKYDGDARLAPFFNR